MSGESKVRAPAEQDYWSIVLRQLRKSWLGMAGLAFIFFLILVAVFAPFLAESIPVVVEHENATDEVCSVCVDLKDSRDLLTLKDGTVLEGTLIRELARIVFRSGAEEIRVTKDKVDKVRTDVTPNILILLDRTRYEGTFIREEPGLIEFLAGGQKKVLDAREKVKLEKLPRRHGRIRTWPLFRGFEWVDWSLLLALAAFLVSCVIYFPLRRRGRTRKSALRVALAVILLPSLAGVAWIALRQDERQFLNTVDFKAIEKRAPSVRMSWPLLARFSSKTIDKAVIPTQRPLWLGESEKEARAAEKAFGKDWRRQAEEHPLGTDTHRRDILAGMIHGTRISLSVGVLAVGIYVTIGLILGALAGYFGGWVDAVISRLIEVVICFPSFFLIITIIAIVPPSIFWIMVVIAIIGWTTVARLVRAEFLKLRKNDFVTSARALGASQARIIFRHILPNALAPVLVTATFGVAGAILVESALSFLGLGAPPDVVTWGSLLRIGKEVTDAWWLALIPGVAIFATVTSYNLFGEALRDALDPRLKGTQ